MTLNLKAFALAAGIWWAAGIFILGIWAAYYAPANQFVTWIGQFYLGYAAGLAGSLIGLVWGFLDAAIGAAILVWLYNTFAKKFAAA